MEVSFKFSKSVLYTKYGIRIPLDTPIKNSIQIDNVDYIPYYLNNKVPGNKGANSNVLKLIRAQEYDEDEGYPEIPDLIIKICNSRKNKFGEENYKSSKFKDEISALIDCNSKNISNLVKLRHHGLTTIGSKNSSQQFRYYTMDYAESDLKEYMRENNLTLSERVSLSLEICQSLKQLWLNKYYHRDIKPDNILFMGGYWMISDLGLAIHRNTDLEQVLKEKGNWIGPRGWMSPESLNKFLAEKTPWGELYDCNIDHQSDIYQLGKVVWYILQGNVPEGGIRRKDFRWSNDELYQTVRTMINHSKSSRFLEIDDVILILKRVYQKLEKQRILGNVRLYV